MYYREIFNKNLMNDLTLINYMKSTFSQADIEKGKAKVREQSDNEDNDEEDTKPKKDKELGRKIERYDFESNKEYYQNRNENTIVGIIDKNYSRHSESNNDVFKIRGKRGKILIKRGTGIPTLKGAVCSTSKDKDYLLNLLKKMPNVTKQEIDIVKEETRINICDLLKIKLLHLEKYSTGKDKLTYMIIPFNHKEYQFPII